MQDKYLNLQGLAEVAEKVNQKLKVVTTMPASPSLNDIVLYNGATTANYKQGSTYLYTLIDTYYEWSDLSDTYYTKSATPSVGDTVYSDTIGTDSGYTITAYDSTNNQVIINSLTYDRNSAGDTPTYGWVSKGGTSVVLNGQDKTGEKADFYAPTTAGADGQVLMSKGVNTPPEWTAYSPNGFAPSFLENSLTFTYGILPEVEGNSLVFDLDGD